jgi:hypothetical protein
MLQNNNVKNGTCYHVLQNGTCDKMLRVTKWYMVQLQNGTCYKMVPHNMVHVTKQYIFNITVYCSETLLTGKSRFHISTPLGIEPGSIMTGSKWVTHWSSETVYECSEIAGFPPGSPPAADFVGCEAGRRTCSKHETGTEEIFEIKWVYHIFGMTA